MRHLRRAADVAEVRVTGRDQLDDDVAHGDLVLRPHRRQPVGRDRVADDDARQAQALDQRDPLVAGQQVDQDDTLHLAELRPGPHPLDRLRHRGHDLEQHRHAERDEDPLHARDELVEERLGAEDLRVAHQGEADRRALLRIRHRPGGGCTAAIVLLVD